MSWADTRDGSRHHGPFGPFRRITGLSWPDLPVPTRMRRVALVAPGDALRDVLVRVADAAAVELGPPAGDAAAAEGAAADGAHGHALIQTAIAEAVGSMPGDVSAEQQVISGRPAVELARLTYGGDLLVLGSRHRGWLRRLVPGSVARSVARRTRCPVVIVPEPSPRALPVPWTDQRAHGHWFRAMPLN